MVQRIAIVGGGIGGLALAAALDPSRFEVTLHEADPARARYGGGLVLWPEAQRALRSIGAAAPVEAAGGRANGLSVHTLTGQILSRGHGPNLLMTPRPVLLAALRESVPSSVRFEHNEVGDPTVLDADLVVGADGVRSRVRGLVHPDGAERLLTPYAALRGHLDEDLPEGVEGEYWGPGGLFGVLATGPGRAYWFTSHRSELQEPLRAAEVASEFGGIVGQDAAPVIRQALASASGPGTTATRIWTAPPLPRYVRGRYVVIGDAAHGMTPNLGRGACDAILDALALARALGRADSPDRALRRWQRRRLPVTQAARATSATLMRLALLQRGQRARDSALRGVTALESALRRN